MIKKQTFPDATIKSLASNEMVYQRGKTLYEENKVGFPYGDYETNTVYLSVEEEKNVTVNFRFYKNGVARKYHCTCPAFESYQGGCKHVVAAMLKLNEIDAEDIPAQQAEVTEAQRMRKNSVLKRQNEEAFQRLLEDYRKERAMKLAPFSKEQIQIEYQLTINGPERMTSYALTMKVGVQHLYVVKDMEQVVADLLRGNDISFGKRFSYSAKQHRISREDRKMLEMLYDIQQVINTAGPYAPQTDKQAMMIPPQYVKMILENLAAVDAGYVLMENVSQTNRWAEKTPVQPKIAETATPLPIHLTLGQDPEEEGAVRFAIAESDRKATRFYPKTNMLSVNGVFHFVSSEQYHLMESLWSAFRMTRWEPMVFSHDQFASFASEVLPQIRNLVEIAIDEEVENAIVSPKLESNLYIDWQNNQMFVRPVFRYGEKTIRPFDSEELDSTMDDKWFIRDMETEYELLELLGEICSGWSHSEGHALTDNLEYVSIFLYEGLEELAARFQVYMTASAQQLLYDPASVPSLSLEMNEQTNLLDISFQTEDISGDDLQQLVSQLKANKQYYRLSNGKLINLKEKSFQEMNTALSKLDISAHEIEEDMSVPLFKGLAVLDDAVVKKGNRFKELARQLLDPEDVAFDLPKSLDASLRPYQETGFKWLKTLDYYGFGGVLADDMGLGKTLQTITFVLSALEEKGTEAKPFLILCPSSVLYNWQREFAKFAPTVDTKLITGSRPEREAAIQQAAEDGTPVWITSYPLIQRDGELYTDQVFETIILDEAQYVKNSTAKTTVEVRGLKSRNKFALSGTPIENNLGELYTLFSLVQPGLFSTRKAYKELDNEAISQKVRPFILRRLKRDVLEDLPEKTETTEYIDLSEEQKKMYQTQLALIRNEMEDMLEKDAFESNRIKVLAGLTRLRQICCAPRLVLPDYQGGSSKLERLLEYLDEARENGKRVVLFSQFTQMLAIIREKLDERGYDYHYLDGSTKKEDRFDLTTRFNTGEKDMFLISLKAGGTGLNLTGGDTVILYDSWWNPAIEEQAADRVHRFGQKKAVQVIRMITRGTIEERINELQEKKRELIDSVIQVGEKTVTGLSKDEILALLD
ncbi:DEAD/DEAH box helicase [Atopococcus tabaci]|uniref:DEAD/DEAH box helicase n=1 Tax=Atopococcus tabaci TaxID=269774 RepID=UPI000404ACBD|nr:DEAD/DEAH box helicase [Atopococcus tabaci]